MSFLKKTILFLIMLNLSGFVMATPTLKEMRESYITEYKTRQIKKIHLSHSQWKSLLPTEQYKVMWEAGTEHAYSGKYNHFYETGLYRCASCGHFVFSSHHKFDSKTGWPSFWNPFDRNSVTLTEDKRLFSRPRIEVSCYRCGAHLGHVFEDGPAPTGLRYCINSLALDFIASEDLPTDLFVQPE